MWTDYCNGNHFVGYTVKKNRRHVEKAVLWSCPHSDYQAQPICAVSHDDTRMALLTLENELMVWRRGRHPNDGSDTEGYRKSASCVMNIPHATCLAVAPSGLCVVGHLCGTISVVSTDTGGAGRLTRVLDPGNIDAVRHCAVSPDGASLAASTEGGVLAIASTTCVGPNMKLFRLHDSGRATPEGGGLPVTALAFSPCSGILAAGARDGSIRLYRVASRTLAITVDDGPNCGYPHGALRCCAFSPDGRVLVSAFDGIVISVLDASSGMEHDHFCRRTPPTDGPWKVRAVTFPSGHRDPCFVSQDDSDSIACRAMSAVRGCSVESGVEWCESRHRFFPRAFRRSVATTLALARGMSPALAKIPYEVLLYMFALCAHPLA